MRIARIIAYRVRIPFKVSFGHARAARRETENIVVETVTDGGVSGFGEGVPREYVTGETPSSAVRYVREAAREFIGREWGSLEEGASFIRDWEEAEEGGIRPFPGAARCALALSLLDALARSFGRGIDAAARVAEGTNRSRRETVRYSAVCSSGSLASSARSLAAFRLYGFRSVKLKVGAGERRDGRLVAMARAVLGRRTDIRVDANGAWDFAAAVSAIRRMESCGVSSVEEPLQPGAAESLPRLRAEVSVPIMLDESVCSLDEMKRAVERGACDMVNIRLSKCGGFFSSIRLARMLRERGMRYQLGCQVGESGILSAAGRHFAFIVPGILHLEGSYDRHLLRTNLTKEDVTFGFGGVARRLTGPGLGVTVDREKLGRLAVERTVIGGEEQ